MSVKIDYQKVWDLKFCFEEMNAPMCVKCDAVIIAMNRNKMS